MSKMHATTLLLLFCSSVLVLCACGPHPRSPVVHPSSPKRPSSFFGDDDVSEAVSRIRWRNPNARSYFDDAYGYAIFPTVGKGASVVGAAYGRGAVYERGRLVGTATLTQLTIGLQLGGQAYSEVIFFEDRASLERFKRGTLDISARASAVAITAGAAADAPYADGIAIITATRGGLMYEAAVGGQKVSFAPLAG